MFFNVSPQTEKQNMEGRLKSLIFFGTSLIIVAVIPETDSVYFIRKYILITNFKMNWIDAQSYCRAEYSDLATIINDHHYNAIQNMAINVSAPFWIGLHDGVHTWKWSLVGKRFYTGQDPDYRQWQEKQPDNVESDEHCVSMTEEGFWTDSSCMLEMPLICFKDGGDDEYVLVVEDKSWFDARNYCRQQHTDLVSVRSPAENLELTRRLKESAGVHEAWIGLHRDSWTWSDGRSSFFRGWMAHQPDNDNNSQACAAMQDGGWDDWNCDSTFNFLCQEMTLVTPAPTSEPATITTVVQRRTAIKIKLLTHLDLTDPTIQLKLLQQFEESFNLQGFTDIQLHSWSVRAETRPAEGDECGEEIKKKLN